MCCFWLDKNFIILVLHYLQVLCIVYYCALLYISNILPSSALCIFWKCNAVEFLGINKITLQYHGIFIIPWYYVLTLLRVSRRNEIVLIVLPVELFSLFYSIILLLLQYIQYYITIVLLFFYYITHWYSLLVSFYYYNIYILIQIK